MVLLHGKCMHVTDKVKVEGQYFGTVPCKLKTIYHRKNVCVICVWRVEITT